ncbi:MAG: DUF523 and DUF1722 domain-containing protein [Candidatus Bathyarchaeota archaeon]|nr:DUF523 and DUF1722 domain-containing protein [Candidatus Bathyarchaeota archaeon]
MKKFPKPIVVISKCIEFEPVRWNAQKVASDFVRIMKKYVNFLPVCPEVEIGLGVPRETLRIVKKNNELKLIQTASGLDLTDKIKKFSAKYLNSLSEVDGFILKSKSPSSGYKDAKIYPSTEKVGAIGKGPGFFGNEVLMKFPHLAIEDEKRLINLRIREHFLTKLYILTDFRNVENSSSPKELIAFQSRNKLLFTAYSQKYLYIMGRIVANQDKQDFKSTIDSYKNNLWKTFVRPPRRGSNSNVLIKAAGYFSRKLSKEEKNFFAEVVNKYNNNKLPLSTPLSLLRSWIIRFKEDYLANQTFLEPYPKELFEPYNLKNEDLEKDYWK